MPAEAPTVSVTRDELVAAFDPFVKERFSDRDSGWIERLQALESKWQEKRKKREGLPPKRKNTAPPEAPQDPAERRRWVLDWFDDRLRAEGGNVLCQWDSDGFLAKGMGTSRVHLLLLARIIDSIRPASILEVGCGSGTNLFVLSALFSQARYAGLELNSDGVARAKTVQEMDELPQSIRTFSPVPLEAGDPHQRIDFRQGNAKDLPFADRSFDVVVTRLALEQMHDVQDEALSEASRVSNRYVVMIEPFQDWNLDGVRRDYVVAKAYFDAKVSELPAYGLEPVTVYDDMPHKVALRPGLVVARKR